MESLVVSEILKHGALGVVVIVQFWVISRLYTRNELLQDKRIEDNVRIITLAEAIREAADKQTEALESLSDVIKSRRSPR